MSWGALNNQRDRSSGDPLPDFLTGHSVKSYNERLEPKVQAMGDVVRPSERPYTPRPESSRGYGVSYVGAVNIQMSKTNLFVVILFFTAAILGSFGAGFLFGHISNTAQIPSPDFTPSKKPIIPRKKPQTSVTKSSAQQELKARSTSTSTENVNSFAPSEEVAEPNNKNDTTVLSEEKNNKEINDSEAIYQDVTSAPKTSADETDD